jgi:hypothetical protein
MEIMTHLMLMKLNSKQKSNQPRIKIARALESFGGRMYLFVLLCFLLLYITIGAACQVVSNPSAVKLWNEQGAQYRLPLT